MNFPIYVAMCALLLALSAGVLPFVIRRSGYSQGLIVSLTLAVSGGVSVIAGISALYMAPAGPVQLPVGLPWLPMSLEIDALSGFFMFVIGALLAPVGIYSVGYLKSLEGKPGLKQLIIFLPLFVVGMQGVALSADAYTFMLFWELMSVSSYFLVVLDHDKEANRKAGFLYLLMAHLAGLLIMGSFAVLYRAGGSFTFSAMRLAGLTPLWAAIAFLLAGAGFGMKAGVTPLHVWLPSAHPAAPSNVSALMSGVMLKVAIYGFIRVIWDIVGIGEFQWWWGALVLASGSGSALFGVLMALQQHDLKKLLAYHSVENVGIILMGLGLAMIFAFFNHPMMAALGLIACLYHTINHALFKGLLFMGAGAVLHSTGTRNMELMGGLIHRMQVTSACFLVACISISALPPFNGFVSEWLTFQTALMAPKLEGTILSALIPFSASILALAGALAGACFVKVYGIVFLGRARSDMAENACEIDGWMKAGMVIPAVLCFLLGVGPAFFVPLVDKVAQQFIHVSLATSAHPGGWLWLTPISGERASYAAPIVLLGMMFISVLIFMVIKLKGARVQRKAMWSCGHPDLNPRMQYTATSFSQPLRHIFSGVYRPEEHKEIQYGPGKLLVKSVKYAVHVGDMAFTSLYLPIAGVADMFAERLAREHQRGIHAYLTWIFVTVLFLLLWVTPWKYFG